LNAKFHIAHTALNGPIDVGVPVMPRVACGYSETRTMFVDCQYDTYNKRK
jgi:hypothetical protein